MAQLKGMYFSVDALLASMVLLAIVSFVIAYPQPASTSEDYRTSLLYASTVQSVNDWNNSIQSEKSVLGYIYWRYYTGDNEKSSKLCSTYFEVDKPSALYFKDAESFQKICGDYRQSMSNAFISETVIPDIPVNQTYIGPKTAVLVIKD